MSRKIKTVHYCDQDKFENVVNELLSAGWKILSTNTVAAINCAEYDYCPSFTAILLLNEPEAAPQPDFNFVKESE